MISWSPSSGFNPSSGDSFFGGNSVLFLETFSNGGSINRLKAKNFIHKELEIVNHKLLLGHNKCHSKRGFNIHYSRNQIISKSVYLSRSCGNNLLILVKTSILMLLEPLTSSLTLFLSLNVLDRKLAFLEESNFWIASFDRGISPTLMKWRILQTMFNCNIDALPSTVLTFNPFDENKSYK